MKFEINEDEEESLSTATITTTTISSDLLSSDENSCQSFSAAAVSAGGNCSRNHTVPNVLFQTTMSSSSEAAAAATVFSTASFLNSMSTSVNNFISFDGVHSGIPTLTTPTLTPTTLKNIEQTFMELQSEAESHQNEAGFVPPSINLLNSEASREYENSMFDAEMHCSKSNSTWSSSADDSKNSCASPLPIQSILNENHRSNQRPGNNYTKNSNGTLLSTTSVLPALAGSSKRRNGGGRKPSKNGNFSPEEEERRMLRRERNKMAAARCRKRRVDHTNSLINETENLERKNVTIVNEIQQLEQERDELEEILNAHKLNCRLKSIYGLTKSSTAAASILLNNEIVQNLTNIKTEIGTKSMSEFVNDEADNGSGNGNGNVDSVDNDGERVGEGDGNNQDNFLLDKKLILAPQILNSSSLPPPLSSIPTETCSNNGSSISSGSGVSKPSRPNTLQVISDSFRTTVLPLPSSQTATVISKKLPIMMTSSSENLESTAIEGSIEATAETSVVRTSSNNNCNRIKSCIGQSSAPPLSSPSSSSVTIPNTSSIVTSLASSSSLTNSGMQFNFESLMDGGTGLTPMTNLAQYVQHRESLLSPSTPSKKPSSALDVHCLSSETGEPSKLVSL